MTDAVNTNDYKSRADFTLVFISLFVLKLSFLSRNVDVRNHFKLIELLESICAHHIAMTDSFPNSLSLLKTSVSVSHFFGNM